MYRPWAAKQNPYNFCLVYPICQVWIWIHSIHTSVTELNTCHNYEHMCGPKTKWHVRRGVGGVLSINTCIVWSLYSPSYYKTSRKDWQEGIWLCHLPFWWESSTDLYMFGIPNAAQQAMSLAGINSHACGLLDWLTLHKSGGLALHPHWDQNWSTDKSWFSLSLSLSPSLFPSLKLDSP